MPTALHSKVLAGQVERPVYTLEEPFDPVAVDDQTDWHFPEKASRHLGWFGYPESFYKGTLSLMPAIRRSLEAGELDSFKLLTDPRRFPNDFSLEVQAFSSQTFAADLRSFDYVLLSHFPLDLHVNSLIKSPNKAVTALVAGTIPIASTTPAYEELLVKLGLQRFLIDSPRGLSRFLSTCDPVSDSRFIEESGALHAIRTNMSEARTAADFLALLDRFQSECRPSNHNAIREANNTAPLTYATFARKRVKVANRLARAWKRR